MPSSSNLSSYIIIKDKYSEKSSLTSPIHLTLSAVTAFTKSVFLFWEKLIYRFQMLISRVLIIPTKVIISVVLKNLHLLQSIINQAGINYTNIFLLSTLSKNTHPGRKWQYALFKVYSIIGLIAPPHRQTRSYTFLTFICPFLVRPVACSFNRAGLSHFSHFKVVIMTLTPNFMYRKRSTNVWRS